MTDPREPDGPPAQPDRPGQDGPPADQAHRQDQPGPGRRRRPRRAVRPGTRSDADESPDLAAARDEAPEGESERDRWLREQRPPHWE